MRILQTICFIILAQFVNAQTQGVNNTQTKLRVNQLRWTPTDATNDSVYIIRGHTTTGEPAWYKVKIGGASQDTTLAGDVVGGLNSTFVRKINGVTVENKTPQGREVLQYDGTKWTPDSIDLADLPTLAQSVLLGRTSASTGTPQAITLGTGLSMSNDTLRNSAPDQTVSITGGGINSVTGTYPNFTVTGTEVDGSVANEIQTLSRPTMGTLRLTTNGASNFVTLPDSSSTNEITVPGGSSMQVQYNNAGAFGGLDSFTVVANPDRVGFGVPIPQARVDIQGSGATSATNALRVRNSSGTELVRVQNNGYVSIGSTTEGSIANVGQLGTQGTIISNNFSSLGNVSGGYGMVGSNYYVSNAGTLVRKNVDVVSMLEFVGGGWVFKNSTTASAEGSSIATTQRAILTSGGNFGLGVATTLAGLHNAINTSASTPSMLLSGTGFSGGTATTTKPTLLIEPTGTTSTGWSTSGTKLGVNAESGFTGRLLDLQLNGVTAMNVTSSGNVNAGQFISTSNIYSGGQYQFASGTRLQSGSAGQIQFGNSAFTDFSLMVLGPSTSSSVALKKNGTDLQARLGDDSGFATSQNLYNRVGSGSPEGVVTAPIGAVYHRTDGGAGTSFYVKESGTGNTGWIAK